MSTLIIGEGKVNLLNTLEPIVHIILLQKKVEHITIQSLR